MMSQISVTLPAVTIIDIDDKTFSSNIYILDQATYDANDCSQLTRSATYYTDCVDPATNLANAADFSSSSCD